jgi:hypothetical protein
MPLNLEYTCESEVSSAWNHEPCPFKAKGSGLAKPKLTQSIGTFYSHTLVWLPRVIEKIGLGMRLNPQTF